MKINKYIDHTLLKPTATTAEIKILCEEAVLHNFFSVCINSGYVSYAYNMLKNTNINICSVVGFPLGAMSMKAKIFEAEQALSDGANEIDMVINIGLLKSGKTNEVLEEISRIKEKCGKNILKVIIETCYLTEEEKRIACLLSVEAGADYVKTSTGFGSSGATIEDVLLMRETIQGKAKIKASGGIRDYQTAINYIKEGVQRIGTSNGVAIIGKKIGEGY